MRIAIGADRRGLAYKTRLIECLRAAGHEVVDAGTNDLTIPADYPVHGARVGRLVADGTCERGVVICGTGIGIMIAANKIPGIRCGIAYSDNVARLMRDHNDANVIAFGQDEMTYEDVLRRLEIFLETPFGCAHHVTRIAQLCDLEAGHPISQTPSLERGA